MADDTLRGTRLAQPGMPQQGQASGAEASGAEAGGAEASGAEASAAAAGAARLGRRLMVLRVAAGAHDWVDTGTGLGIGLAAGFGTAALHTRALPVQLTAGANGLALRGTF